MKRYCQTLTLVDDEDMIEKYVEAHAHVWPEVIASRFNAEVKAETDRRFFNKMNRYVVDGTVNSFKEFHLFP